jgi:hypothetical protein
VDRPSKACVSKCKKVWWDFDLSDHSDSVCRHCGGLLSNAVEDVHFKVVKSAKREVFKSKDFISLHKYMDQDAINKITNLGPGQGIKHFSLVKPAFVDKAKNQWR